MSAFRFDPLLLDTFELDPWELQDAGGGSTLSAVGTTSLVLTPAASGALTTVLAAAGTAALTLRATTPWEPAHESGLQGWWATDDLRNTHDGTNFASLFDKSGNSRTATATGTTARTASGINGLPVATLDGASTDGFTVTGALSVLRNKGGVTAAAVYDITDQGSPAIVYLLFCNSAVAGSTRFALVSGNGSTANAPGIRTKRLDADSTVARSSTTPHTGPTALVGVMDWANADAFVYVDGALEASSTSHGTAGNTSDTDSASNLRLGRTTSSNNDTHPGDIGEWVLYDVVLGVAARQKLEGYLAHRWGTALPSGHPYENAPPLFAAPTLVATTALIGTATLTLATANATLNGVAGLAGTAAVSLAATGTLTGAVGAHGSTALAFVAEGALSSETGGNTASTQFSFEATGSLAGSGTLAAAESLTFSAAGTGQLVLAAVGTSSFSLAATAAPTGRAAAAGASALSLAGSALAAGTAGASGICAAQFTVSGTSAAAVGLAGSSTLALAGSGSGVLLGYVDGTALLAAAATGVLLGRAAAAGTLPLALQASLRLFSLTGRPATEVERLGGAVVTAERAGGAVTAAERGGGADTAAERQGGDDVAVARLGAGAITVERP